MRYILLITTLLPLLVRGQDFSYEAGLATPPADGLYTIPIPAGVTGQLQTHFADLRLFDSQGREVPYLWKREEAVRRTALFREYEVVSRESRDRQTSLVLRNRARTSINNLSLLIKNARVSKKAQLSGSDDAKNWYVIEADLWLQSADNEAQTAEVKLLRFPLSDYEYYRLDIQDSTSAPLNILKAGYYDELSKSGKYTLLGGLKVEQKDSNRVSSLRVVFPEKVCIDKIELEVAGPQYYRRVVELCEPVTEKGRRGKMVHRCGNVLRTELDSRTEASVYLNGYRAREFYLKIDNEDNPPLQVRAVRAKYLGTYLVAELKRGETYRLKFGNPALAAPSYDLSYFSEQIPRQLPTLALTPVRRIAPAEESAGMTIFTNKNVIWAALALVVGLLGYMSFRMMQEVKK